MDINRTRYRTLLEQDKTLMGAGEEQSRSCLSLLKVKAVAV